MGLCYSKAKKAGPVREDSMEPQQDVLPAQLCSHNVCKVLRQKDWEATEKLLTTGQGIDISMTKFLERALYEGCPKQLIAMILQKGANPVESTRCLSDAIIGKVDVEIVRKLLNMGCSPNRESDQDKLKRSAMHFACQTAAQPEILDLLLEYGGDVNIASGDKLWTPLHYLALGYHNSQVLEQLVLEGANINARAVDGTTPMAIAAFKIAPAEFFRTMLNLGADPSLQTRTSRNPLFYIKFNDGTAVAKNDVRYLLLDPNIHRNQVHTLFLGLHKRLGRQSQLQYLNADLLVFVGEFLLGEKCCQTQNVDAVQISELVIT